MQYEQIIQAWVSYCDSVLNPDPQNKEWTVTIEEDAIGNGAIRPPKPYVSLKIISGPGKITIDDDLVFNKDDGQHYRCGQRAYTLSIKSFGVEFMDGLSDIANETENPDLIDQLISDAHISIIRTGTISDISAKLETGFEKRGTLDIEFLSSHNKIANIETIEKVEISGSLFDEQENENELIITNE